MNFGFIYSRNANNYSHKLYDDIVRKFHWKFNTRSLLPHETDIFWYICMYNTIGWVYIVCQKRSFTFMNALFNRIWNFMKLEKKNWFFDAISDSWVCNRMIWCSKKHQLTFKSWYLKCCMKKTLFNLSLVSRLIWDIFCGKWWFL